MLKKFFCLLFVVTLFFMGGCWDMREINSSSIPLATSADFGQDNNFIIATQFIKPTPPGETAAAKNKPIVVTARDYSQSVAVRRIGIYIAGVPEWAHVNTFILGENLARKDLSLTADLFLRTRVLRPDINLMVASKVTPTEILSAQLPQISNLGKGLQDLLSLQGEQLGIYTPTTFHDFTYKLLTPGIEPVVPQITLVDSPKAGNAGNKDSNEKNTNTNDKKIILSGMAVFKNRTLIGSLNETESRGYHWANSSGSGGHIIVASPLNAQDKVSLEAKRFSSKTRPVISDGRIKMQIHVKADLLFYEQMGTGELLTLPVISQLEQKANREIATQISSCIDKSQDLGSDILGWGLKVYQFKPGIWEQVASDWNVMFPSIESEIKVETKIRLTNLTGKSFSFE